MKKTEFDFYERKSRDKKSKAGRIFHECWVWLVYLGKTVGQNSKLGAGGPPAKMTI